MQSITFNLNHDNGKIIGTLDLDLNVWLSNKCQIALKENSKISNEYQINLPDFFIL